MTPEEQKAYDRNLLKISELIPEGQFAVTQGMNHCFADGDPYQITDGYRSQNDQNMMILKGRWTEKDFWDDVKSGMMTVATAYNGIKLLKKYGGRAGSKVTYTLSSNHTKRIAFDIRPLEGGYDNLDAYERIAETLAIFGITHPMAWDKPHFEVTDPVQPILKMPPFAVQLAQVVKAIGRYAGRTLTKLEAARLRMLGRKKARLEEEEKSA